MAISEEQLSKWERLAKDARKGPWYVCGADVCTKNVRENTCLTNCAHYVISTVDEKDCAFIAASREAVPALIARVRSLQKMLHAVSDINNKILDDNNRLEKEADWLAKKIEDIGGCRHCGSDCGIMTDPVKCWREAARKAVKDD